MIGIGLLKFDLFDLKPIARDKTLDVIDRGILVFDPLNRLIDINKAARKLLQLPKEGKIGIDCHLLLVNYPTIVEAIKNKEKISLELKKNHLTGHLQAETTLITDQNGVHLGVLLLVSDISLVKDNQHQIQKQSEELSELNKLKDKLYRD